MTIEVKKANRQRGLQVREREEHQAFSPAAIS